MDSTLIKVQVFDPFSGATRLLPVQGFDDGTGFIVLGGLMYATDSSGNIGPVRRMDYTVDSEAPPSSMLAALLGGPSIDNSVVNRPRVDGLFDGTDANTMRALYTHGAVLVYDPNVNDFRYLPRVNASDTPGSVPLGVPQVANPLEWSAVDAPASATRAIATRAAGTGGQRHVCRSITATMYGNATNDPINVFLRDGDSTSAVFLWAGNLAIPTADGGSHITISGLNIVGSPNTQMTLDFAAAPGATNVQRVTLTGYTISP